MKKEELRPLIRSAVEVGFSSAGHRF